MAFNATTLSAAIGASDTSFGVASATGITAPNFTTGVGLTYLLVEQEMMLVTGINGTVVTVQRGVLGSRTAAHGATAPVLAGLPSDFAGAFSPLINAVAIAGPANQGWSAPVASATTITATGSRFHITGSTAVATINPYPGYVAGDPIYVVLDGAIGFTTAGNIAVVVTGTSMAGKMLVLVFDTNTSKWYNAGPVA